MTSSSSSSSSSSSLFLTLLLLLSNLLITYQTNYAITTLFQGSDIKREREPSPVPDLAENYKLSVDDEVDGRDGIQRKELHEVHSGPNPISNSIPPQWQKTKLETKP